MSNRIIIPKSDIPEPVRFVFTKFAMGDTSENFGVTDEERTCIFFMGTELNCKKYVDRMIESDKNESPDTLTLEQIDEIKGPLIEWIKEGNYSSEISEQLEDMLGIFRTKK